MVNPFPRLALPTRCRLPSLRPDVLRAGRSLDGGVVSRSRCACVTTRVFPSRFLLSLYQLFRHTQEKARVNSSANPVEISTCTARTCRNLTRTGYGLRRTVTVLAFVAPPPAPCTTSWMAAWGRCLIRRPGRGGRTGVSARRGGRRGLPCGLGESLSLSGDGAESRAWAAQRTARELSHRGADRGSSPRPGSTDRLVRDRLERPERRRAPGGRGSRCRRRRRGRPARAVERRRASRRRRAACAAFPS